LGKPSAAQPPKSRYRVCLTSAVFPSRAASYPPPSHPVAVFAVESRFHAVAYDKQITADWHLTMPLAGGIREVIVESLGDSLSPSRHPVTPASSCAPGPISGLPRAVRVRWRAFPLAPFGTAETSCP